MAKSGPDSVAANEEVRRYAKIALSLIQVSGEPIDPATPASQLGADQMFRGFQDGAVLPQTLRQLFQLLLTNLDGPERRLLGEILRGSDDENRATPEGLYNLYELANSPHLGFLDRLVPGLHVTIDAYAPTQAVVESMKSAMRDIKQQLSLPDTRRRHDVIPDYLAVWDLREGWGEGRYDATAEQSLREIARQTGRTLSTVVSQYRSAFELITGYPYDPCVWLRIFGILKTNRLFNQHDAPRRSIPRALTAFRSEETRREAAPAHSEEAATEQPFEEPETLDPDAARLAGDLQVDIRAGLNDDQIIERHGLGAASGAQLLAYLRSRFDEGL